MSSARLLFALTAATSCLQVSPRPPNAPRIETHYFSFPVRLALLTESVFNDAPVRRRELSNLVLIYGHWWRCALIVYWMKCPKVSSSSAHLGPPRTPPSGGTYATRS